MARTDLDLATSLEFEPNQKRTRMHVSYDFAETLGHVLGTDKYIQRLVCEDMLQKVSTMIAEQVLASAAVQARIAQIRAELPVRIETAVAQAITAAVLKPLAPVEETDNGD